VTTRKDTRTVARRMLTLSSVAELRRELDVIEAAHRNGTLTASGNWGVGPNLLHIALPIRYAIDGFPKMAAAPLRWLARWLLLPRLKREPFRAGVNIGRRTESEYWRPRTTVEEGLAALRAELDRLEAGERMTKPHALFGAMTHEDWLDYNLKHANLHLGFVHPGGG
jgi:hypothetical protein